MPSTGANLRTVMSFDSNDHNFKGAIQSRRDAYGVKGLWEITKVVEVMDTGTYRPIYDWCLCVEHTRLAQAHQAIQAVYRIMRLPSQTVNLTVDGFIFKRPRNKSTVDRLKTLVEGLTVSCLPKLEGSVRKALEQPDPKQKRLRTDDLYPIRGHQSDAQVFRLVAPEARQHPRGYTPLPVRDWRVSYVKPEL